MEQKILVRHVKPFINANYHVSLGLNELEFIKLIPNPNLDIDCKDFELLLLIIPSNIIDFKKQLSLASIKLNVKSTKINLNESLINKPYWIYFQDGTKNRGKSPNECRTNLSEEERGLTVIEGIALYLQYPNVVKDHSVDLIESFYGNECTPTIYSWKNKVMMSAICSDVADSMCGSATCLKEVI